jgi:hypothetical protein
MFQPERTGGRGVYGDLLKPPIETYDAVETKYCVLEQRAGGGPWMEAETALRYH